MQQIGRSKCTRRGQHDRDVATRLDCTQHCHAQKEAHCTAEHSRAKAHSAKENEADAAATSPGTIRVEEKSVTKEKHVSQQALMSNLYLTNTPHNADLQLLRILSTIRT